MFTTRFATNLEYCEIVYMFIINKFNGKYFEFGLIILNSLNYS